MTVPSAILITKENNKNTYNKWRLAQGIGSWRVMQPNGELNPGVR